MVLFLDPETTEILQFLDQEIIKMDQNTSLAAKGALAHRLQCQRGLDIGQPLSYWTPKQPLLFKFFYSITPSMRTSQIRNG